MTYQEERKQKLEEEYIESLERFKSEYFELCYKINQLEEETINAMKLLKVLEALIAFYGELDKKGEKKNGQND